MDSDLKTLLRELADRYETADFINGDPSWFMHQVEGRENQEVMAFIASVLSYGKRDQFLPKIQYLLDSSKGQPSAWVKGGGYRQAIPDNTACYYRLYNNKAMLSMLDALKDLLNEYGSLGAFAKAKTTTGMSIDVLSALSQFFQARGIKGMVASPKSSVAKRPCMFLRWMVRDASPVDMGLWTSFIDKRSLFIPMDTHVLQEARTLGLVTSKTASWASVERLTESLREVFPDDPVKGDFALFGYGVNKG